MQAILFTATLSGISTAAARPSSSSLPRRSLSLTSPNPIATLSLSPLKPRQFCQFLSPTSIDGLWVRPPSPSSSSRASSSPISSGSASPNDESARIAQVKKRLEKTSMYFKRLGSWGFWGQLVCTVVAALILSFSVVASGRIASPTSFYATAGGIVAAFVSVFFSFGYIRISEKLRRTVDDPAKAPPRAVVMKSIKTGIVVNVLGMGAAILGMQANAGLLVAKALTSSATPYFQGIPPETAPVLGLDVFLVQASASAILSHFMGLAFSLELLHSVTLPAKYDNPDVQFLRVV